MKPSTIVWAVLLSLLPIAELRGSIPFSLANGMPVAAAFALCVVTNMLVGPIAWLFLSTLHRVLSRWRPYATLFERIVERARRKVHAAVVRWGYWGLAIFVAIPLPFTGAWTGALGAWVLGMEVRKSLLAVAVGVLIAGVVVTLVAYFGIKAFSIFLKT
ncbi:MAG: ligand-binding protein SH3 [Spirochaetes bacterium RBG_13_68_11]|nr:MAG: ligand-binding protein SH3 [Spirochaetes bacterium RBG_13_68_11]